MAKELSESRRAPVSLLPLSRFSVRGLPRIGRAFGICCHFVVALLVLATGLKVQAQQNKVQTHFRVKYVSADSVYLEGGANSGLSEGQKLTVKRKEAGTEAAEKVVAEIVIESVASSSAAGRIISRAAEVVPGDIAYLSHEDVQKLEMELSEKDASRYPQIVSFNEGDPLDEEVREDLPKPPLPEVNRIRGRVGVDLGTLQKSGQGAGYSQFGFMLRMDATRLAGSHWNLSGYYRGRLHSQGGGSSQTTLTELINRTYHLSLSYDNPNSHWVAGVGRLYIPWAVSLSTIDGFYLGRRYGKAIVGAFGGSAPDPTSWSYDARRQMGGGFVNFETGSFESFRFTSTSGIALSRVNWHPDRQFGFFENGIFYKHYLSVYSDVEADLLNAAQSTDSRRSLALSRSYLTVRLQPLRILSFDISDNYFRNIPTFDERLVSTGLLDRYLFQGLSGGFRLELPYRLGVYTNLGHSSRSGDTRASWDYLYGLTARDILNTGVRADFRYSKFDSSFGRGTYCSLSLSRELGEGLRFDLQAGQQNIASEFTRQSRARFINGNVDWFLGSRYFLGLGITVYRGDTENYNEGFLTLGYRFDNRGHRRNAIQIH